LPRSAARVVERIGGRSLTVAVLIGGGGLRTAMQCAIKAKHVVHPGIPGKAARILKKL